MIIFVTGGAGFIGSALIRYMIRNTKHTVINIDKLTYASNLSALKEIEHSQRYRLEKVDILCYEDICALFDKYQPDRVMHLAAESHVDRSIDSPVHFIQTNIVGTFNLLEASRKYLQLSSRNKTDFRFHHISTDEVFGELDITQSPLTEMAPYKPSSPYSASKASSDHLVQAWGRTYGLPYVLSHCSNNYGPWQYPEKLIPFFVQRALTHQSLPVYGDGLQIRDWLHVDDHVEALYLLLNEGKTGHCYNIGGNNERTNREVINMICDSLIRLDIARSELDSKVALFDYKTLITSVDDRAGHDFRYAIDSSKIQNELGWQPKVDFQAGLEHTVSWYYRQFHQADVHQSEVSQSEAITQEQEPL